MKEEEERTPLRTILQNFLNHIEKLDKEKLEGSYDKEFQELKLFSEFLKTSKQYSCSQGEKEVNRKKNRYKDILPFDCSRVILEDYAGIPGSDYINANYIKGASGSPAYIASQGPLPHTVNDFWRMVVQCEVQVIVMACNEEEAGKHKCENYWVEREGEEKQFGMVAIQLMKASVVCPDFLVRTMRLKYTKNHSTTQEERTVCQFHYSAWPDHGVPPLVRPLLDMVRLVRDTQASETLPVLVHCSAGCGRTGTICAIDYVWGLLRAGKLTRDFSLFKLVREMRKQRIAMVQTKEQYILVHHAVKELFNEQLRMIDSHPYENIDVNGMVKESPEPLYATITPETNNEEKQDSNEKDVVCMDGDDAPPLPCKRKPYTAHTKQEKEVENLSQKHRSTVTEKLPSSGSSSPGPSSSNSSSISGSLLHKPRIAKLRALFERTSNRDGKSVQGKQRSPQQVTRSHSLGAVRKLDDSEVCVQPIPNKGILRVPQLSASTDATYARNGRPALPIKRSKSLKVLSSGERSKFSVPGIRGTFSPESQNKNPTKDELRDQGSSLKISIPVNDMFVREEVKPHVPPKKVQKDKVSERKTSKSPCGTRNLVNAPNVSSSSKMSEETHTTDTHLSSMDYWKRRSLDSLPFESELPASSVLPNASHDLASSSRQVFCRLDDEAKKLFQDCRDYLNERTNCESSEVPINSGKQVQSPQGDPLKNITVEAQRKVHAVVVGLGIRERRNSFRQAISKDPECSRTSDYESLWPRTKEKSTDHAKLCNETQSAVIDKSPIDPSSSRKKFLSKAAGHSVSMQIQQSPARILQSGKTSVGQKTEQLSNSLYPKSTLDMERGVFITGKGSFGGQSERPMQTLFTNSKEGPNLEIRRAPLPNVPANTNLQQSTEPLYVKGNVEQSRHDSRPSVPIPMSVHTKGRSLGPDSLGATEDSCRNSERRVAGHSFTATQSTDARDSKSMNVPQARRVNTAFKGRCMVSGSRIKHSDQFRIRNNEIPTTVRNIYSEDPQVPQPLLGHHEASHPTCVASEVSIVEEVNSATQGNLKGQVNSSISMKLESNKTSKYSERVEIGSGAVRRVNMLPGSGKVISGSQANGPHSIMQPKLDHRFWGGMDPGISGVRVLPGVDRETSVTVPEGNERSVPSTKPGSRVVPKMNLKQKDGKVSENSSCSNSSTSSNSKVSKQEMEAWIGAPGIDVDMVGASIKPSRDHGTPLARALEAFHFRKSSRAGAVSPQQQRKVTQPQVFVKKQHYL